MFNPKLFSDSLQKSDYSGDSLLAGSMGHCICQHLISQLNKDLLNTDRTFDIVADVFDRLSSSSSSLTNTSMGTGLSGFTSVIAYLIEQEVFDDSVLAELTDIDQIIFKGATLQANLGHTDFLFGCSGPLSYFLNQKADMANTGYINGILSALINGVEKNQITRQRIIEPNRFFSHVNLGIAHGITGTALVLCKAVTDERVKQKDQIWDLLDQTLKYLKEQINLSEQSIFPIKIEKTGAIPTYSASQSWSYGDFGVLCLLYTLAALFKDNALHTLCGKLFEIATEKTKNNKTDKIEIGLRHGLAGQLLLLQKLSAISKNTWCEEFTKQQFSLFYTKYEEINPYQSPFVFEAGLGAVAIRLNERLTPKETSWTKIFLM
ncbi:hypothetical protein GCM10022289_21730 [Pedobacter jeongneungensis]|uniref:Lanthionine synthetase-like protein n=1 Tax=Pedobacter jeongneungensis TaxID=947309 RepID=A0ABP8BDG8_9SPHI